MACYIISLISSLQYAFYIQISKSQHRPKCPDVVNILQFFCGRIVDEVPKCLKA